MLDLGWPLNEKAQKEIDDKDRKPSKEIRVEAVRDMVEFTQRTASSSQDKIVLIYPAEKLNLYASNMILKTLEEPAGSTRFIVSSEAAHQLLPTIRSRCQTHTMIWPNDLDSLKWLEASGLELKEANVLLKASGGRPNDARPRGAPGHWRRCPFSACCRTEYAPDQPARSETDPVWPRRFHSPG